MNTESDTNINMDTPAQAGCVPRLDRRDGSFPDFDRVSVNTSESEGYLSFWKNGKSYSEISLPLNPELGQAIFVGLERYVKRHYPKMEMFQQE